MRKAGWLIRDSQVFETDLKRRSDFTGTRARISVIRSSESVGLGLTGGMVFGFRGEMKRRRIEAGGLGMV